MFFFIIILTMLLFLRRLAPTLIAGLAVPLSLSGATQLKFILGPMANKKPPSSERMAARVRTRHD